MKPLGSSGKHTSLWGHLMQSVHEVGFTCNFPRHPPSGREWFPGLRDVPVEAVLMVPLQSARWLLLRIVNGLTDEGTAAGPLAALFKMGKLGVFAGHTDNGRTGLCRRHRGNLG